MSLRPLALIFLLLPMIATAQEGVLIEHVPSGASPDIVIRVITQAFNGRQWISDNPSNNGITGRIIRRTFRVQLRIEFSNGQLLYSGQAERLIQAGNPADPKGSQWISASLPPKWLENLRNDIGKMFATIPDR